MSGSVREERCRGSNGLIKEGATLVDCAADILQALLPQVEPSLRARASGDAKPPSLRKPLGLEEQRVYDVLSYDAQSVDAVIEQTQMSAAHIAATLLSLELSGHVRQLPGQQYMRR